MQRRRALRWRLVLAALVGAVATVGFGQSTAGAQDSIGWIDVNIRRQQAVVFAPDGSVLREIPISSGANGRTPTGVYAVQKKSSSTVATSNPAVSMRWMTNFNGGIGFHGIPRQNGVALSTPLGQRAVSHGCIRMADENILERMRRCAFSRRYSRLCAFLAIG
jgi:hypothetical protein